MNDYQASREDLRGTLRRRGIYLLPNLFTSGVLFSGFYAIVQAMNGRYELAATAVFVAMVLDGLDGRIARLTRTQSEFGAQYDSLADVVAFGAAPALIMYEWALQPLGRLGWIVAFVYCVCVALRLARFNTNIGVVDKRWFQGLPSPSGAALVAGLVWIMNDLEVDPVGWGRVLAVVFTLFAAITMVSSIPFYSFKTINFRRAVPFWAVLVIVLILVVVTSYPPLVLFSFFVVYSLSGYVMWLWNFRNKRSPF
ncbi:MAG: CDP-diacylglycerol--serine O-phosphatidyltransferase [Burkholderiales bacterium]|nr:CDP-diacylglycerol--serine O-phosphatidyltransferase [Burkholderiales bacterium]PZM98763.1 MAG: CDP-diacylglycerol--serine O-phosphatidyltransferase [Pseudomonadota bacterium]